jgi:hypothetical protein
LSECVGLLRMPPERIWFISSLWGYRIENAESEPKATEKKLLSVNVIGNLICRIPLTLVVER